MSIKKNVVANYVGQFYRTIIGIVMVPVYVRYMGAEAYGLVGIFALLQAWFQLLDVGLSPTMMRQAARFQGGDIDATSLRRLVRAMEGLFIGVGLIGCLSMMAGSSLIASRWLKVQHLSLGEVQKAIMLMAAIVCLRWVSELYRGAITGFERLVWLNGFGILVSTVRFVFVLVVFKYIGTRPVDFFGFQLVVALVEVAILVAMTYRLLPARPEGKPTSWDWAPLKENLHFSLSIAFSGLVWVLVTQADKLILSKLLPLTEYAYYTLAVVAASGVSMVIGPVSVALMPRLTRLAAEGDEAGLVALYRHATQAVAAVAIPASLVLAFFPQQVLWAWTGNAQAVQQAAPVLRLYGLGNGFMALAAFPYYLQFAKGNLRLHLMGNAMFVVLLVPGLIWATARFGATGAGWVWLAANAGFFLLWTPLVHHKFVKGLHFHWLVSDVVPLMAGPVVLSIILGFVLKWPSRRPQTAVMLLACGVMTMIASLLGSSWVRGLARRSRFSAAKGGAKA